MNIKRKFAFIFGAVMFGAVWLVGTFSGNCGLVTPVSCSWTHAALNPFNILASLIVWGLPASALGYFLGRFFDKKSPN